MEESLRNELNTLLGKAEIEQVFNKLLAAGLPDEIKQQVILLQSRFFQLEKIRVLGIKSPDEINLETNQLSHDLLNFINNLHKKESSSSPTKPSPSTWKYITFIALILGMLGSLAEILNFINIFPNTAVNQPLQLTILVEDKDGNVILEDQGELIIDFGNDRRSQRIGQSGRTNFGEIPVRFNNSMITIGFDMEGFEIADGKNQFKFTGEPIHLIVKRDDSLGQISGIVKNRDGSKFIENALVLINNDTSIYTNNLGIFKINLPTKMQVNNENTAYILTVKKENYGTVTQSYLPKSSNAEIRFDIK